MTSETRKRKSKAKDDDASVNAKGSKREYCDSCDGTGLMEGWNRRDGSPCPKCHGAAVIVVEPVSAEKG